MAGAHGNRTHQEPVSRPLTGFEDRAGHQPRTHSPMLREPAEVVARRRSGFLARPFSGGEECQAGRPDLREYSCGLSSLALLSYRYLWIVGHLSLGGIELAEAQADRCQFDTDESKTPKDDYFADP